MLHIQHLYLSDQTWPNEWKNVSEKILFLKQSFVTDDITSYGQQYVSNNAFLYASHIMTF